MTNPPVTVSPAVEVRAWAARQLRFEQLLRSLEQQAGLLREAGRPPRP